ncbi:MAG: hypothetical protein LBH87_01850 [Coriobacteriales bacterium]|jgi:drug/metabolite transporter (DMT)-like permease|nr:hypothetical protein [Coriobacteriales bacterium]
MNDNPSVSAPELPLAESADLKEARHARRSRFMKKGIIIALGSGVLYGVYSACLLAATGSGSWIDWYGAGNWYADGVAPALVGGLPFSFLLAILILGALGSGLNDFISSIWMIGKAGVKGKFKDFLRCYKSKPGAVMAVCALIGGPVASTAYLIALTMAGPIATPISALCPAIGAIIGRILFKQKLNFRMVVGILICITATFMIGSTAFSGTEINVHFLIGLLIALISALGWGIEGAVAGFGTSVMDYEISISIRQFTSGVFTLFILTPTLFIIAGHLGLYPSMLIDAFRGPFMAEGASGASFLVLATPLIFFLISGLAAGLSFGFWYKGNSMCGAALGMACNGTFSFWVPFFSFLICGLYLGWGFVNGSLDASTGYVLAPIQWAAAIVMVIGIFLIAVNPLELFKKKKEA